MGDRQGKQRGDQQQPAEDTDREAGRSVLVETALALSRRQRVGTDLRLAMAAGSEPRQESWAPVISVLHSSRSHFVVLPAGRMGSGSAVDRKSRAIVPSARRMRSRRLRLSSRNRSVTRDEEGSDSKDGGRTPHRFDPPPDHVASAMRAHSVLRRCAAMPAAVRTLLSGHRCETP
jgi:hypothetical protein